MAIKIVTVLGARPQFIKASAISSEFRNKNLSNQNKIEELIIHTGQHFDKKMSECFFSDLNIPEPIENLGIGGKSHGAGTGQMIELIEKCLLKYKPDHVLVQGDTNSTLAGSLAASKLNISILHIEAGLRSYNRIQPEEKNRVITDYLSEICFAPTDIAVENLLKENINRERIFRSGDINTDVLRIFKSKINAKEEILTKLNLNSSKYCILTFHRQENTNNKKNLENILQSLDIIDIPIVLPLHPRTKQKIYEFKLEKYLSKLIVCEPLNYFEMIKLTQAATLVITDSGGLQKESYLNKVPCLTIKETTEWVESVDSGWNLVSNPENKESLKEGIYQQLNFDKKSFHPELYGNGFASKEIVDHIIKKSQSNF